MRWSPQKKAILERNRIYYANIRAKNMGAEGYFTIDDIMKIRMQQDDKCNNKHCKISLNGKGDIDHIIPIIKGGTNWPNNLQLLCRSCNSKKDNHILPQYKALYAHRMTQRAIKEALKLSEKR